MEVLGKPTVLKRINYFQCLFFGSCILFLITKFAPNRLEAHWNILYQVPAVRFRGQSSLQWLTFHCEGLKDKTKIPNPTGSKWMAQNPKNISHILFTNSTFLAVKLLSPGQHTFSCSMKILLVKRSLHSSAFSKTWWWEKNLWTRCYFTMEIFPMNSSIRWLMINSY